MTTSARFAFFRANHHCIRHLEKLVVVELLTTRFLTKKDYDFCMMAYANKTVVSAKNGELVLLFVLIVMLKFPNNHIKTRPLGRECIKYQG